MINPEQLPTPLLDPAAQLESGEGRCYVDVEGSVDLFQACVDYAMLSNDSRVFRRKVWACLSVVCPSRVPTNQRTVADAAKVHGVSTGALYKLKSQAREYFDDYLALQKNKASLTLEESSAGSDFMPSFSHGKGRKGRNARK